MSGHSKWATTKRAKAVVDAKRGKTFTKLANAITVAAKEGGGNIEANPRLRTAIESARAVSMPKDNIERAIKRGTGELGGAILETVFYEGFGPGNVAMMIEVLTDSRNRAAQAIKSIMQKYGATLGGPGSVAWMFDRRGIITVTKPAPWGENAELALIELGIDDIIAHEDELTLLTAPEALMATKDKLLADGWQIVESVLAFWPKTPTVFPEASDGDKLTNLLSALDDEDDIQYVSISAVL